MESTAAALLRGQAARENSLRGSGGRISKVSKEFTDLNFFKEKKEDTSLPHQNLPCEGSPCFRL